jgi:hypothetical protein
VYQNRARTFARIIEILSDLNTQGKLPRLKSEVGREEDDIGEQISVKE